MKGGWERAAHGQQGGHIQAVVPFAVPQCAEAPQHLVTLELSD